MDRKREKNIYLGSWAETPCDEIDLPFTYKSLKLLLASAVNDSVPLYTHQQIANWCYRFWLKFLDDDVNDANLEKALGVSQDVETQWDLYLSNTYSLKELQELNFSQVMLPEEWFKKWLRML
jgi:hypothetical protein